MAEETGAIAPTAESPITPREPLHLRYLTLVKSNANFRRLWLAQLISEIGDWFYSLAVYDLLFELTHSGEAVSWAIILQLLPWFFMTPIAGSLADRFPRRRLMILTALVQGFVVLGLLMVRKPSDVWLVYVLLGIEVVFASVFEPARNALLPNITATSELLAANAISSATWSVALAAGAASGGVVTALLGRQAAFVINSLSFFASAALIRRIEIRETHLAAPRALSESRRDLAGLQSLWEASRYLRENPKVTALVLAKTGLGCIGGVLLLLAVFGERIFPIAGHGPLAMGLLYAARGAGAGLGPLIGDRLTAGLESRMWKAIGASFFLMGSAYVLVGRAPNLALAALAVFFGHMGGSNVWVMSTTLLQLHVQDRFRGRVFALDLGMNMLAASVSNYLLGLGLDSWKFTARQLASALGVVLLLPGLLWLPAQAAWGRAEAYGSNDSPR